jgi:hypothetical protein
MISGKVRESTASGALAGEVIAHAVLGLAGRVRDDDGRALVLVAPQDGLVEVVHSAPRSSARRRLPVAP